MAPSAQKVSRTDAGLASSLRVSIARLNRRLRTERGDREPQLSVGGIAVLAQLFRDGDRTIGQLAASERVQPPSMTRTVAWLEKEDFVERLTNPDDGRQVVIRLTPAGHDALMADRRRRDAWLNDRLRELTPDERAVLRAAAPILERLSAS